MRAGHLPHSPAAAEGACRQQLRVHAGSRGRGTRPATGSALGVSLLLISPALGKREGGSGGLTMMEWLASQCRVTHNVVAFC